jgi:CheY-like chemotaxis protein
MPSTTTSEAQDHTNYRILYVDDDPACREAVPEILRLDGNLVETAEDEIAAWLKISAEIEHVKRTYDLIITELCTLEMDGFELVRLVRRSGFPVRIMLYARHLPPEYMNELRSLAIESAVQKSHTTESLRKAVGAIRGGRRND